MTSESRWLSSSTGHAPRLVIRSSSSQLFLRRGSRHSHHVLGSDKQQRRIVYVLGGIRVFDSFDLEQRCVWVGVTLATLVRKVLPLHVYYNIKLCVSSLFGEFIPLQQLYLEIHMHRPRARHFAIRVGREVGRHVHR